MAVISDRKIAILCNPLAGVGRSLTLGAQLEGLLQQRQIPHQLYRETWPANFEGYTDIFISGGDGTVNYFINHYPDCKEPITLFNGGTGNDFHWTLYRDSGTEARLEKALHADARPVDAGRCNGKLFMNGLGLGFEGQVAFDLNGKKKAPGKISFMRAVLRNILFYRSRMYTIQIGTRQMQTRGLLMAVMNGIRSGGGFHMSPGSDITDGLLNFVRVDPLMPLKRIKYLPSIEKGKHLSLPFVHADRLQSVRISSDREIRFHLDGECHCALSLQIECLPGQFFFRY